MREDEKSPGRCAREEREPHARQPCRFQQRRVVFHAAHFDKALRRISCIPVALETLPPISRAALGARW
eukprot:759337-Alexandrium_andersonii.AAC.1